MKQLAMGKQVPWYCENKKIVMFSFGQKLYADWNLEFYNNYMVNRIKMLINGVFKYF